MPLRGGSDFGQYKGAGGGKTIRFAYEEEKKRILELNKWRLREGKRSRREEDKRSIGDLCNQEQGRAGGDKRGRKLSRIGVKKKGAKEKRRSKEKTGGAEENGGGDQEEM